VAFTNPADTFIGAFSGDASGLTNFSNASSTSDGSITSNLFVQVSVNPAMRANAAPRPPMGYAAVTLDSAARTSPWLGRTANHSWWDLPPIKPCTRDGATFA